MDSSTLTVPKVGTESMEPSTISTFLHRYNNFMKQNADPRSAPWPLVEGVAPTLLLTLAYIVIVKGVGPKFMKGKQAIRLTNIVIVYNFLQVIFNAWICYRTSNFFWGTYSIWCQPVDKSNSISALRDAEIGWWYYISKLVDFVDTIFLVLAKKEISFLAVIHHASMPFNAWLGVRFAAGGHSHFAVMANSFIHVLLYSYYFLSSLGPKYRRFLWWKRYLTNMQMIQFVMIFLHCFQLYFWKCDYPMFVVNWYMFKALFFFGLFGNFYIQTYLLPRRKGKLERKKEDLTESAISNGISELQRTKME